MFTIKKVLKHAKSPFFKPSMTQNMDLKSELFPENKNMFILAQGRNNKMDLYGRYRANGGTLSFFDYWESVYKKNL